MITNNYIITNILLKIGVIVIFSQTSKLYCDSKVINNSLPPESNICISSEPSYKNDQPILFLTIPKSGTHLLEKAYHLIINNPFSEDDKSHFMGFDFIRFCENPLNYFIDRKKNYSIEHFWFDSNLVNRLHHDRLGLVILVRDPRDVIMSIIYEYNKRKETCSINPLLWNGINLDILPFDKKISALIQDDTATSLKSMYQTALKCMEIPSAHIVYFEDLVGVKGGGNIDKQKSAIHELANYVGHPVSDKRIDEIIENLFGGTRTFNKGQIGSWKEIFTLENIEEYNQIYANEISLLGYN